MEIRNYLSHKLNFKSLQKQSNLLYFSYNFSFGAFQFCLYIYIYIYGLLANHAAAQKRRLYQELTTCHRFVPIAFESTGAFGEDALYFIKEVAKRSRSITKDPLSYLKLCQQISVCIQNFNAASILGCCID